MYKAVVFDFDGTVIDTEKHLFDLINTHLKFHQVAPISINNLLAVKLLNYIHI